MMRKCLFFFVVTFTSIVMLGQDMSAYTRKSLEAIQNEVSVSGKCDCSSLPVYSIEGKQYLSLFGLLNDNPDWSAMPESAVMWGSRIGSIQTLKVDVQFITAIAWGSVFQYIEVPDRIQPHLNRVRQDLSIDSIHAGVGLPFGLNGEGVIVGVTDWGFDYTHPMFYDSLNGHTRIIAAWDQYRQSGETPQDFNYGVEFNTESELLSALGDTANIYSYGTHGTHVAGIAGGSGAGTDYIGMAPMCNFLFATFLIDAASVIDAYTWMKSIADAQNKRLVINQSWGLLYMGTLDGNSLLSQAIDTLADQGVVFSSSAGNNGDVNFHIMHDFDNDTVYSRIQFDAFSLIPTMWGQSVTMWGEPNHSFSSNITLYSGANEELISTHWFESENMPSYFDSILIYNNDTVFYNVTTDASFPLNQRPHMRLRVRYTGGAFRVGLKMAAESGVVHAWNVIELVNEVGNWGQTFGSLGGSSLTGDINYGISEPACTGGAISVAAYSARYTNAAGNYSGGVMASFTSSGPLITGEMKPDVAAPGVNVGSSISAYTDGSYGAIETVNFNGTDYTFSRFSGTSMSAPCVSGVCALLLQQNPELTPAELKQQLKSTARVDEFTGPISSPGDVRWGMGKVNPYQIVTDQVAVAHEYDSDAKFYAKVWPNPSDGNWQLALPRDFEIHSAQLFDGLGREFPISSEGNNFKADLPNGLYYMRVFATSNNGDIYLNIPLVKAEN